MASILGRGEGKLHFHPLNVRGCVRSLPQGNSFLEGGGGGGGAVASRKRKTALENSFSLGSRPEGGVALPGLRREEPLQAGDCLQTEWEGEGVLRKGNPLIRLPCSGRSSIEGGRGRNVRLFATAKKRMLPSGGTLFTRFITGSFRGEGEKPARQQGRDHTPTY